MKLKQTETESKLKSQKLEVNCVEMGRYFNRLQESYSIVHQMRMLGKKEWQSRGVARNKYLGGPGCNRYLINIILKSIGYKIINFHISLYT